MAQVIWSPQALEDLRAICEYIGRDSEQLAILTVTRILRATDQLEDHPLSGRTRPSDERIYQNSENPAFDVISVKS